MLYPKIRNTSHGVRVQLKNPPTREGETAEPEPTFLFFGVTKTKEQKHVGYMKLSVLKYDPKEQKFSMSFGEVMQWLEPYEMRRLGARLIELGKKAEGETKELRY